MLFGVHIEITSPVAKPRFRTRNVEKSMEYCLTCEKVRELFVRAFVKVGGDEGELIGLK